MSDPTDAPGEPANPFADVVGRWDDVLADMAATAAEYREDGWTVHECHPGDVAALDGDDPALDVVLPGDEFETVRRVAVEEGRAFEDCEVFRALDGSLVFLVVVERDATTETAVVYPAYYDAAAEEEFVQEARDVATLPTHLRGLDPEDRVTFTHDDPSLFLPVD
jgi:hypothetical protein